MTVVTPGGTSPVSIFDQFSYGTAPTVSGISPATGPLSGGTTVTIAGTNLSVFTTLDDPSSANGTVATAISGSTIVGYYIDSNSKTHGFVYNGSSFSTLDDPAAANGTYPEGISGSTIVGFYLDSSSKDHGFVYNGSSFSTLDDPSGSGGTVIIAVSASTIVGYYMDFEFEGRRVRV